MVSNLLHLVSSKSSDKGLFFLVGSVATFISHQISGGHIPDLVSASGLSPHLPFPLHPLSPLARSGGGPAAPKPMLGVGRGCRGGGSRSSSCGAATRHLAVPSPPLLPAPFPRSLGSPSTDMTSSPPAGFVVPDLVVAPFPLADDDLLGDLLDELASRSDCALVVAIESSRIITGSVLVSDGSGVLVLPSALRLDWIQSDLSLPPSPPPPAAELMPVLLGGRVVGLQPEVDASSVGSFRGVCQPESTMLVCPDPSCLSVGKLESVHVLMKFGISVAGDLCPEILEGTLGECPSQGKGLDVYGYASSLQVVVPSPRMPRLWLMVWRHWLPSVTS